MGRVGLNALATNLFSRETTPQRQAAAVGLVAVAFAILMNMLFSRPRRLFCSYFIYLLPLPAQVL